MLARTLAKSLELKAQGRSWMPGGLLVALCGLSIGALYRSSCMSLRTAGSIQCGQNLCMGANLIANPRQGLTILPDPSDTKVSCTRISANYLPGLALEATTQLVNKRPVRKPNFSITFCSHLGGLMGVCPLRHRATSCHRKPSSTEA